MTTVEPVDWSPEFGVTVIAGVAAPAWPANVIAPAVESVSAAANASMPRMKIPFLMALPPIRYRLIALLRDWIKPPQASPLVTHTGEDG